MNILASTLVALSVFDFLTPVTTQTVFPVSSFSQTGAGELTVSLTSSDGLGSVAKGATRVPLGILNFIASCDADITVESIDLRHIGLGSTSDIRSVYLVDGFRRLTRAQKFDSQRSAVSLRFTTPVKLKRCDVARFTVMVDISQTAQVASEHSVALMAGTVRSSAKTVTIDESKDSTLIVTTPYQQGTITVRFLQIHGPLRYGRRETVARIQLTADVRTSHLLKKIVLTNTASARDMSLVQFSVEKSDGINLIAPATRMHGRTVVLEFSPSYLLEKGQSTVLNVLADVRASQSDTVNFTLEEPSDLYSIPSNIRR